MITTLFLGSKGDTEFAEKIKAELDTFGISSEIIVASAHKVPGKVVAHIEKMNSDPTPRVIVAVVGMSNGLGGVLAGSSVHPVLSSPPYANTDEYIVDIHSNLRMPSDVPLMTVVGAKNAAVAVARIFGERDAVVKQKVKERLEKVQATYN